jgi:hypothetical protein
VNNRRTQQERVRGLPFHNTTNLTIPPFALLELVAPGIDGNGIIQVQQPSVDGSDCFVNGPSPVVGFDYGECTNDFPMWVAYNGSGGTPSVGETWGAAAGWWLLTAGKTGFLVRSSGYAAPTGPGSLCLVTKEAGGETFTFTIDGDATANTLNFDTNQFVDSASSGTHDISIKTVGFSGTFLTGVTAVCNSDGTLTLALTSGTISGNGIDAA